jgi:hypothetical protein
VELAEVFVESHHFARSTVKSDPQRPSVIRGVDKYRQACQVDWFRMR